MRATPDEFIRGLRAGEPRAVQAGDRLLRAMARQPRTHITPREHQVLELAAQGLTNKQIGKELWITEETVRTHMKRLRAALGARNKAEAVAVWLRRRGSTDVRTRA